MMFTFWAVATIVFLGLIWFSQAQIYCYVDRHLARNTDVFRSGGFSMLFGFVAVLVAGVMIEDGNVYAFVAVLLLPATLYCVWYALCDRHKIFIHIRIAMMKMALPVLLIIFAVFVDLFMPSFVVGLSVNPIMLMAAFSCYLPFGRAPKEDQDGLLFSVE